MTRRRGTNRVGFWGAGALGATTLAIALTGLVTSAGGATAKHDAAPAATPSPCNRTSVAPAHYQHVVVIVMENKQYSAVIGNPSAPYLTGLAYQCASAINYAANSSPSRPNYLAMTSGTIPAGCAG